MISKQKPEKILIFRHGSVGDTVVALPCFHLIARVFPEAERRLLTTISPDENAAPVSAALEHAGLVHRYMTYPVGSCNFTKLFELREEIKKWAPEILIYLAEPRSPWSAWRDALFFKLCGIKKLVGVPYTKTLRENYWLPEKKSFEYESKRLVRCLETLGDISLDDSASWDLRLTKEEEAHASRNLEGWKARGNFIACNVSAKVKAKDWGKENWRELFHRLSQTYPDLGIVMIGARAGAEQSEAIARAWRGPTLNLCGKLTLRESVAVMKRAIFYLGHDSGPMHLAASVGIPCVALFVASSKPGVWFPYGNDHQVIHHQKNGRQVSSITVDEVFKVTQKMIEKESVKQ